MNTPEQIEAAYSKFREFVIADVVPVSAENTDGSAIDPHGEYDWYSLSLGFFLAQGLSIENSAELATRARYKDEYWR